MALNKEQEDLYKKTMQEVKRQLEGVDALIEKDSRRSARSWRSFRSPRNPTG